MCVFHLFFVCFFLWKIDKGDEGDQKVVEEMKALAECKDVGRRPSHSSSSRAGFPTVFNGIYKSLEPMIWNCVIFPFSEDTKYLICSASTSSPFHVRLKNVSWRDRAFSQKQFFWYLPFEKEFLYFINHFLKSYLRRDVKKVVF